MSDLKKSKISKTLFSCLLHYMIRLCLNLKKKVIDKDEQNTYVCNGNYNCTEIVWDHAVMVKK